MNQKNEPLKRYHDLDYSAEERTVAALSELIEKIDKLRGSTEKSSAVTNKLTARIKTLTWVLVFLTLGMLGWSIILRLLD